MKFMELIPTSVITNSLGDEVIYVAKTGQIPIKALISEAMRPVNAIDSHLYESRFALDVAVADVPGIKKGSKFIINGDKYVVDDITNNDGQFATLVLR